LDALQYRQLRYGEDTSKRTTGKRNKTFEGRFRRNLAPHFTHYLPERLKMSSQLRAFIAGLTKKGKNHMKHRNTQISAALFVLALALTPIGQAAPSPDGGPIPLAADEGPSPVGEKMPLITVHSTDNVTRGKIGTFVLNMSPVLMLGGMFVNFSVSGSAQPGVDYVALVSPAHIGQAGYGVIQVQTLSDPRGSSVREAYSVVITLKDGAGYLIGNPSSATMWIKP
jgi:hypothetical protein